eukprot:scaffold210771_cov35-Prasinocladus_malaysianus.AAC.1
MMTNDANRFANQWALTGPGHLAEVVLRGFQTVLLAAETVQNNVVRPLAPKAARPCIAAHCETNTLMDGSEGAMQQR